jgi:hypothetical protein
MKWVGFLEYKYGGQRLIVEFHVTLVRFERETP